MKAMGSNMEYAEERMNDLLEVFDTCLAHSGEYPDMDRIYSSVVDRPARRFYVSERRAAVVVSAMLRGKRITDRMRPMKRAMFREICRRVRRLRRSMPHASVINLCQMVVEQPAPRFYLQPGSAKTMICRARREWKARRRRNLLH